MFNSKPAGRILNHCFLPVILLVLLISCGKMKRDGYYALQTDTGFLSWELADTAGIRFTTYLDRGERKNTLFLEGSDSPRLKLVSPKVQVVAGKPISFRFSFQCRLGVGELFEAHLNFFDSKGSQVMDTLLYRIRGRRNDEYIGTTQEWMSYTRCLEVPQNGVSASVEITSAPQHGKVWLGEIALVSGEDWMTYAVGFSSHLQQNPQDKYIYIVGRHVEPQGPSDPRPEEKSAGMVFFERKDMIGAWPYALPTEAERVAALVEKAPGATIASFVFGVRTLENLEQVKLSLAIPLAGPRGKFPGEPVLFQGKFVAARLGSSWGKEFGIDTQMLTVIEPMSLPKGRNQFYWVDVSVPGETPPGVYEGELAVAAEGKPALKIPFRLEVQPVVLPAKHNYQLGMYYYPPDDPELMDIQLQDMAAHGVYAISLAGSFVEKNPAGGLRLNQTRFEKLNTLMSLMRKHGFFKPTALFIEDMFRILEFPEEAEKWTDADRNLYERAIRLMSDTAKKNNWCKLWLFPIDEPANSEEKMKLARIVLGIIRKIPGVIPYCDLNSPESVLELSDYIDVICMQILSVSPKTINAMNEKGVESYFYLPGFGWSTAWHRGIAGWFLPRSGANGIYYFAYQSVTGDPYDELDGTHRDWSSAYPAPAPHYVWPCPQWQGGIRRGIEDLRLKALADQLIEKCLQDSRQDVQEAGNTASKTMASIYQQIDPTGPGADHQLLHDFEPGVFEQWRQKIIGQVLAMQEALK